MIKLFVTDLDGTLLYRKQSKDHVNEKTKNSLKRMHAAGVKLMIASGRYDSDIKEIERFLPHKTDLRIGMNGGTIYDADDNLVNYYTFTPEQSRYVYDEILLHARGSVDFLVLNTLGGSRQFLPLKKFTNPLVSFYWRKRGENINSQALTLETVDAQDIVLKYMLSGTKSGISKMKAILSVKLEGFEVMTSSPYSLEICPPNINKGFALKSYMAEHGLTPDQVAFIGDAGNDIAGFQAVEHSFCMSHATKTTQSYAKHVVKDVSEAIEMVLDYNADQLAK